MSPAIWHQHEGTWRALLASAFANEEELHDLVEQTPNLLPLGGDPTLVVIGREVALGGGYADLVAVDQDGHPVIVEIKLRRNAEARRAVVAQVLTYAAELRQIDAARLEFLVRAYVEANGSASIVEAVAASDQSGEFDRASFASNLTYNLAAGAFRLVLVLDEAPPELVRLVGYLESVTSGVALDVIAVSAFRVGEEQILVPQRVDLDREPEVNPPAPRPRPTSGRREVEGSEAFERGIAAAAEVDQPELRRLLAWARDLEREQLATLRTVFGRDRQVLLVWVRGQKAGLVSIWNDEVGAVALWRSVLVRLAWEQLAPIEQLIGEPIGQGTMYATPGADLLDALTAAYRAAATFQPSWNGRDFYVAFGENEQRSWDDARALGFVSAGGGEWYSKTLHQLKPGHRVFVYIPRGNGVGGYVGMGEVTGEARMAKDFTVERDGERAPYLDVATAPAAAQHAEDAKLAEWVVPVRWIATRAREDAVRDPDFFANQNTAVKLTHGYTLKRLPPAFDERASGSGGAPSEPPPPEPLTEL